MNIGERATVLANSQSRERVLAQASVALLDAASLPADELVPGETVARILAAAMVREAINGSPKVITKTMSDGVSLKDGIG